MSMTAVDPSAGGSAGRSTRGQVPLYTPRVNGNPIDFTATEVSAVLTEGSHDSFSISAISPTLENTEGLVDSAISFYFGTPPRTELFSGYIMEITDEQKAQGQLSFNISVLGATKVLFQGKPRFWRGKAATSAISDLAINSGLGFWGHTHSYLWKSLAQTDESDWAYILALAKRIGWVIFNRYGVVLCYDPVQHFREGGTYTRIVSGLDDPQTTDRMLLSFESTLLSSIAKDTMGLTYGYFTGSGDVQITNQPGDFVGYVFDTKTMVRSPEEAKIYEQAAASNMTRWAETAVARVWGDADFFPGRTVEVVTAAKRWYAPKTDGRWMINGVTHQADRQQFQTMLLLSRPDQTKVENTPMESGQTYSPFWMEPNPPKARPTLSLNEKIWVSSWANEQLRGLL